MSLFVKSIARPAFLFVRQSHFIRADPAAKNTLPTGSWRKSPAAHRAFSADIRQRVHNPPKVVPKKGYELSIAHPKLSSQAVIVASAAQPIAPHIPKALANLTSFHSSPFKYIPQRLQQQSM